MNLLFRFVRSARGAFAMVVLPRTVYSTITLKSLCRQVSASRSAWNIERISFDGTVDRYNGVTVDSQAEPCGSDDIKTKIEDSLQKWEKENRRCIWFKVYIQDASWVPLLVNVFSHENLCKTTNRKCLSCDRRSLIGLIHDRRYLIGVYFCLNWTNVGWCTAKTKLFQKGFKYHHARDGFVMMFRWLPDSKPEVPPTIHTHLCVGSLVLNDSNQLLAVSEKHYDFPHWKLPGGYVERGEDIADAAIREVREETGVLAEFQSVVTVRHTHRMMFGDSNFYFIVMLRAISQDISICERELNKCRWMEVEEYLSHPHVHEFNRSMVTTALDYKRRGIKIKAENKTVQYATMERVITVMSVDDI